MSAGRTALNGIFITFEGPDGSGKTTQIRELADYLVGKGFQIFETREPGGTVISEKIRDIILDPGHKEMAPEAETLLYAAARAQLVSERIRPALEAGKVVVCDRFVDSSVAYQGGARKQGDAVKLVNGFATAGIRPDLTFLLLLDPAQGRERASRRQAPDRIEQEDLKFHQAVYQAYLQIAREEPERVVSIDAGGSVEEIRGVIRERITRFLEGRNE